MARKKICITLTRPQPCRFDGRQLILQNELNLEPVKVLSDCLANFVSELESAAGCEVEKCSTTTLDLDEDHYYVCVVIDVEESGKFGEMEIQRFLTYLFDDGQASFFDSTTELPVIPQENEDIARSEAEKARASLAGTVLMDEVSVFLGEQQVCKVAGRIKKAAPKLLPIDSNPKIRRGSFSGYCRFERVVHFIDEGARKKSDVHYDPAYFNESVSRVSSDAFNRVEIVTQEMRVASGRVAVTLISINEIEKDSSSLF